MKSRQQRIDYNVLKKLANSSETQLDKVSGNKVQVGDRLVIEFIINYNFMASNQKFEKALNLIPFSASASSFFLYIVDSLANKQKLSEDIRNCLLDDRKCRFNVWRMLMGVFSVGAGLEKKIEELNSQREGYKNKKSQAYSGVSAVRKENPIPKNPLMKAMIKTPKVEQVDDEFLKNEIRKDVERTYQQQQFFQQEPIIKLLSTVLFVWCKRNPDVSYKQGMNEVLASIVYVYFQEVYTVARTPQGFAQLTEQNKNLYILFNSIEYAEADIYCVFEKIMNIQNQMYKTETDSNLKGVINPNSKNNTPILQRILTIIDQKLKALDIQLFRTIKLQDVQTKSFLLRWIRCMHTREFTLENSFIIWDSIFLDYCECPSSKDKNQFEFIDAMCVAMFVYMRSLALTRETAYQIQQIYQKYPNLKKGGYLEELINIAWSLCQALRQPTSLNSSDWVGQQNNKADSKIVTMKAKPKQYEPPKPKEVVAPKPKQPVKETKQVKAKEVQEPKPVEIKIEESKDPIREQKIENGSASEPVVEIKEEKQVPHSDFNFPIVLAAAEWQLLVEKLQKSLALNSDEQSRKFVLEGMQILKSKVQNA